MKRKRSFLSSWRALVDEEAIIAKGGKPDGEIGSLPVALVGPPGRFDDDGQ